MHGYADFLSVGIRVSYRWVPRNRVGAFILQYKILASIGRWSLGGVNQVQTQNFTQGADQFAGERPAASELHNLSCLLETGILGTRIL